MLKKKVVSFTEADRVNWHSEENCHNQALAQALEVSGYAESLANEVHGVARPTYWKALLAHVYEEAKRHIDLPDVQLAGLDQLRAVIDDT